MILEIPRVPCSPNDLLGRHWRFRSKNQSAWRDEVWYALCQAGYARLRVPLPKARVSIERISRHFLDPDNLVGSIKPILDGLRYAKVIENDTPEHIELYVTQSRGKPLTKIYVQPVT